MPQGGPHSVYGTGRAVALLGAARRSRFFVGRKGWGGREGGGLAFWLGIFGVEGLIEGFGLYWDYKLREGLRLLLDFAYGFGVEAVVRFYVTRQRCCMYARPAH